MGRIAVFGLVLTLCAQAQYTASTVAGGGFPNNAPALSVSFTPRAVAAGPGGTLFIADSTTVYKLNTSGAISVYGSQSGGIASLAVDPSGNLYVLEANNNRVQQIAANTGVVRTFAG